MRILLIGGTGFIGRHAALELIRLGHVVTIFHRGSTPAPDGVDEITGDRNRLPLHSEAFRSLRLDVVVDFTLSHQAQAKQLIGTFRGVAGRIVAISSGDVYKACGILHGFESGPLQPMPLTEESDLRTSRNVYGAETLTRLRGLFPWLGEKYDKIPVEQEVMSQTELPGTVLRLPMVYGPGDPLHRLFPYLKRMDDRRTHILLQEDAARWRGPRGYVENVAAAIALASVSSAAAGRIYNVAEERTFPEQEWVKRVAKAANWTGTVALLPRDEMPEHLRVPYRSEQDWEMSSAKIRSETGFWEPVGFETGLARTIDWERANRPPIEAGQFDYAQEDAAVRHRRGYLSPFRSQFEEES